VIPLLKDLPLPKQIHYSAFQNKFLPNLTFFLSAKLNSNHGEFWALVDPAKFLPLAMYNF